jgi:hypothetical protein
MRMALDRICRSQAAEHHLVSVIVGERAEFIPADPSHLVPEILGHVFGLIEAAHPQHRTGREIPGLFALGPFAARPRRGYHGLAARDQFFQFGIGSSEDRAAPNATLLHVLQEIS